MRDYGKVNTAFWGSDDIRALSDDGKLLALYLMTGPHTNLIGCFRVPDGYVSEDLGWDVERVSEGFQNLQENGFATRDPRSKWVFIHKFLKWNEIENPNQGKAAVKLFDQIPASNIIKHCVATAFEEFAPRVPREEYEGALAPYGTVAKPLPKPFRNQEQEQEQEKESPVVPIRDEAFETAWSTFPTQRKGAKDKALIAWRSAFRRHVGLQAETIIAGINRYCRSDEVAKGFAKGMAAWLNDDRWTSDYGGGAAVGGGYKPTGPRPQADDWAKDIDLG